MVHGLHLATLYLAMEADRVWHRIDADFIPQDAAAFVIHLQGRILLTGTVVIEHQLPIHRFTGVVDGQPLMAQADGSPVATLTSVIFGQIGQQSQVVCAQFLARCQNPVFVGVFFQVVTAVELPCCLKGFDPRRHLISLSRGFQLVHERTHIQPAIAIHAEEVALRLGQDVVGGCTARQVRLQHPAHLADSYPQIVLSLIGGQIRPEVFNKTVCGDKMAPLGQQDFEQQVAFVRGPGLVGDQPALPPDSEGT